MRKVCHDVVAEGTNYFGRSAAYCGQFAEVPRESQ